MGSKRTLSSDSDEHVKPISDSRSNKRKRVTDQRLLNLLNESSNDDQDNNIHKKIKKRYISSSSNDSDSENSKHIKDLPNLNISETTIKQDCILTSENLCSSVNEKLSDAEKKDVDDINLNTKYKDQDNLNEANYVDKNEGESSVCFDTKAAESVNKNMIDTNIVPKMEHSSDTLSSNGENQRKKRVKRSVKKRNKSDLSSDSDEEISLAKYDKKYNKKSRPLITKNTSEIKHTNKKKINSHSEFDISKNSDLDSNVPLSVLGKAGNSKQISMKNLKRNKTESFSDSSSSSCATGSQDSPKKGLDKSKHDANKVHATSDSEHLNDSSSSSEIISINSSERQLVKKSKDALNKEYISSESDSDIPLFDLKKKKLSPNNLSKDNPCNTETDAKSNKNDSQSSSETDLNDSRKSKENKNKLDETIDKSLETREKHKSIIKSSKSCNASSSDSSEDSDKGNSNSKSRINTSKLHSESEISSGHDSDDSTGSEKRECKVKRKKDIKQKNENISTKIMDNNSSSSESDIDDLPKQSNKAKKNLQSKTNLENSHKDKNSKLNDKRVDKSLSKNLNIIETKKCSVKLNKVCNESSSSDTNEKENESKSQKGKPKKDPLARYKSYLRIMGIRISNYDNFFKGSKSIAAKKSKLLSLMEEKGLKGQPTIEKCKKIKKKIDTKKEIEELDLGNIITSEGRGRRNVFSLYSKTSDSVLNELSSPLKSGAPKRRIMKMSSSDSE